MCLTFKSNKGLFPGNFGNTVGETYKLSDVKLFKEIPL